MASVHSEADQLGPQLPRLTTVSDMTQVIYPWVLPHIPNCHLYMSCLADPGYCCNYPLPDLPLNNHNLVSRHAPMVFLDRYCCLSAATLLNRRKHGYAVGS